MLPRAECPEPNGWNRIIVDSETRGNDGIETGSTGENALNFTGLNFTGLNFTGLNFTGLNFTGLNFTGLNFTGLNFTGLRIEPSRFDKNSTMNIRTNKRAVILLSGGLDSTTVLAMAKQQGFELCCISFRYGQRHAHEIEASTQVALKMGVFKHIIVDIDLRQFGGSALTSDIEVPKSESVDDIGSEIPVTYVPARNTIFLSFAMAYAEVLDSRDIFIGVNALDYSGYPDCRPEYIAAFQQMANLATKSGVEGDSPVNIHAPLINLTKAEIIRCGLELGVDYGLTTSCYDPNESDQACGNCDACLLRKKGFAENGINDPSPYQR
ncbi:MAG: 7-cyano-7-deazaguanine synthase [Pirellulaceae bacterium]|jgi:7-cyano-7-deazaguanine synthase